MRMLAPDLALVSTSGGAVDARGSSRSRRTSASYEIHVVKRLESGAWKLAALQVTRQRPIHGFFNAMVWQAFNAAWTLLVRDGR